MAHYLLFNTIFLITKHMTLTILLRFSLTITALAGALCGCHSDTDANRTKTIKVEKQAISEDLFFSGTIKPIKVISVSSPVEGIIKEKQFQYGQPLQANQRIITLSSNKLAEDYQTALVNYLKAKNTYLSAKEKFIGTQELMKHQLIAKELFDSEQRQLSSSHLDYLQAKYKLQELNTEEPIIDDQLSLENIKAAAKAIRKPYKLQSIYAPAAGIALTAPKSDNNEHTEEDILAVGAQVKAGQVLLTIGDLKGIAVDIQVPEIDIDKVKPGLPVSVTGAAFPGIQLQGQITAVAAQAKPSANSAGGLPTFSAEITVPKLTEAQRKKVYVGMTAKVAIRLQDTANIAIPIQAVYEKNHQSYVKVQVKGKQITERLVTTGRTSQSQVFIESGLQPGERVLLDD